MSLVKPPPSARTEVRPTEAQVLKGQISEETIRAETAEGDLQSQINNLSDEIDNLPDNSGGMRFVGAWNDSTSYLANDVVVYSGSTYVAVSDSTGQDPSASLLNTVALLNEGLSDNTEWGASISYTFLVSESVTVVGLILRAGFTDYAEGNPIGIASFFHNDADVPWLGKYSGGVPHDGSDHQVMLDTPALLEAFTDYSFVDSLGGLASNEAKNLSGILASVDDTAWQGAEFSTEVTGLQYFPTFGFLTAGDPIWIKIADFAT